MPQYPEIVDNDKDEITITLHGKEIRAWCYYNEEQRRQKMLQAFEYMNGYIACHRSMANEVASVLSEEVRRK